MRELFDDYGFATVAARGFAAYPRRRPIIDGALTRLPSVSRRFLIAVRKR